MPNIHLFTAADIEKLKQCARKLKRAEGIPHHLALERVAQAVKAPTWHHVVEAYKATDAVDQALVSGLVLAFDVKDADHFDASEAGFVADDQRIAERVFEDIVDMHRYGLNDDGVPAHQLFDDDQIREFAEEDLWNYRYFRLTASESPHNIEAAMVSLRKFCFFGPRIVWLRGACYDTFEQTMSSESGKIVGVQWRG
ncbi:hypothetical protein [Cupriavidus sp. CP313]